jgi:hypothetical protein
MAYDGYDQLLCANGHSSNVDAHNSPVGQFGDREATCRCKALFVWYNAVDQTNDSGDEDVVELVEKTPAQYKNHECKCCDKVFPELIAEATYHIPTDKGHMINKETSNGKV